MNEIVKFRVSMADLIYYDWCDSNFQRHRWTALELNIMMAVLSKLKYMPDNTEKIKMQYLFELATTKSQKSTIGMPSFVRTVCAIGEHLSAIRLYKNNADMPISLFEKFEVTDDNEDYHLHVKLSPESERLFVDVDKKFVRFYLSHYVSLQSVYSKLLFIHLKQYRTQGKWTVNFEVFRALMGKPNATAGYVNRSILPIAVEECCTYFERLSYRYEKRGKKIVRIIFEFIPEKIPGKDYIPLRGVDIEERYPTTFKNNGSAFRPVPDDEIPF